jgi:hypothetical protein
MCSSKLRQMKPEIIHPRVHAMDDSHGCAISSNEQSLHETPIFPRHIEDTRTTPRCCFDFIRRVEVYSNSNPGLVIPSVIVHSRSF